MAKILDLEEFADFAEKYMTEQAKNKDPEAEIYCPYCQKKYFAECLSDAFRCRLCGRLFKDFDQEDDE